MADTKSHLDLSALENLSDVQREAVHSALKTTLDTQLAKVGAAGKASLATAAGGTQHTRESGPLHGSQHDKAATSIADHDMMTRVSQMDEKQFAQFSERLATLKGKTGGGV